jgi:pilus assembly protein CpaE
MDFRFGQVAMQLDAQPTYTLAELCETLEQIDQQMIDRAMFKHSTGVHVLARPADLGRAERINAGQAAGVLAALQEHYDFVVLDLPARFDASARAVFDMADTYLLVLQLLVPSVRNADRILHELRATGYALERVRLICSRFGRESGYLEQADVEATLKRRVDFMLPDEWKTSAAAINMGAPLLTMGPKTKLRAAYRQLAISLAADSAEASERSEISFSRARGADANDASRKGLFSFLAGSKS